MPKPLSRRLSSATLALLLLALLTALALPADAATLPAGFTETRSSPAWRAPPRWRSLPTAACSSPSRAASCG